MSEYKINYDESLFQYLTLLINGTESKQLQWTREDYSPLSLEIDRKEPENSCVMQTFFVKTHINKYPIIAEITERIFLENAKGDYMVLLRIGEFEADYSLTYDQTYTFADAKEIGRLFNLSPVVAFSDLVLPLIVDNNVCNQLKMEYPLYLNSVFCEYRNYPIVKLAIELSKQGRALDFHNAVLNFKTRFRLMDEFNLLPTPLQ